MNYNNILYIVCIMIGILSIAQIISYKIEKKLIFEPVKIDNSIADVLVNKYMSANPDDTKFINNKIITSDAETLDALFYKNNKSDKLLLFIHGNAGNIYDNLSLITKYGQVCSILIFDYRGYGLSSGEPSETGMHNDVIAAWIYAQENLNYDPKNIVLYGRSLGCANALWLGKKLIKLNNKLPKGIIIESGFYNLKEIITDLFASCLNYFTQSKFNNIKYIQKINKQIPLFIMHSQDDELINIKHAYKLINDANYDINKDFMMLSGGHNSLVLDDNYYNTIKTFIES